ncbi:hypothetical protein [Corynebacterium resistens]|uniref:hypothetical protein n=1 Tax=Corynebacterium resistens TaxID=258224 RepID=UPI002357450D|nr:hypothetical protein [Corynebacterium resistens]
MERVKLVDVEDLKRSVGAESPFDERLAEWAIEIVSATCLGVTGRAWVDPLDVPPAVMSVLGLATRRLYTNPDRFNREAEGDYSYGLDSSVTKADVFTPTELATLKRFSVAPSAPRGIGTIGTYRGDEWGGETVYVPDGTRYGFPWYARGDV